MKVKVQSINPPYTDVPTESLQAILRNHAHNRLYVRVSAKQLYEIMGILADRRKALGSPFQSNEDALADFKKYYMPKNTCSPPIDYAGGYDHALLELSDVLPAFLYNEHTSKPQQKKK